MFFEVRERLPQIPFEGRILFDRRFGELAETVETPEHQIPLLVAGVLVDVIDLALQRVAQKLAVFE
jgi:hypothetical protein